METKQKQSNFIVDGTKYVDNNFIKEKNGKHHILVSQLGITEPIQVSVDPYGKPQTQLMKW